VDAVSAALLDQRPPGTDSGRPYDFYFSRNNCTWSWLLWKDAPTGSVQLDPRLTWTNDTMTRSPRCFALWPPK